MVICLQRGANDQHLVQLMSLPLHHLLLRKNPEWFTFLVSTYPANRPEKRPLNGCSMIIQYYIQCIRHLQLNLKYPNMES